MRQLGLVLLAVVSLAAETAAEPARPLRVVTYNLFHGGASSGLWGDDDHLDARLDLVAAELKRLDPDVVGLQEASIGRGRGHVAARLAGRLGFHHVHAPATPWAIPTLGPFIV